MTKVTIRGVSYLVVLKSFQEGIDREPRQNGKVRASIETTVHYHHQTISMPEGKKSDQVIFDSEWFHREALLGRLRFEEHLNIKRGMSRTCSMFETML